MSTPVNTVITPTPTTAEIFDSVDATVEQLRLSALNEFITTLFGNFLDLTGAPATSDPEAYVDAPPTFNLQLSWNRWIEKDMIWPMLREMYVQRDAVDIVLASLAGKVDKTIGVVKKSSSQLWQHWNQTRATLTADIERTERQAAASRTAVVGELLYQPPCTGPIYRSPSEGVPCVDEIYPGYGYGYNRGPWLRY